MRVVGVLFCSNYLIYTNYTCFVMYDMHSNYSYNYIFESKVLDKSISPGCYYSKVLDDANKKTLKS